MLTKSAIRNHIQSGAGAIMMGGVDDNRAQDAASVCGGGGVAPSTSSCGCGGPLASRPGKIKFALKHEQVL